MQGRRGRQTGCRGRETDRLQIGWGRQVRREETGRLQIGYGRQV
jgi:hypothetical protein